MSFKLERMPNNPLCKQIRRRDDVPSGLEIGIRRLIRRIMATNAMIRADIAGKCPCRNPQSILAAHDKTLNRLVASLRWTRGHLNFTNPIRNSEISCDIVLHLSRLVEFQLKVVTELMNQVLFCPIEFVQVPQQDGPNRLIVNLPNERRFRQSFQSILA